MLGQFISNDIKTMWEASRKNINDVTKHPKSANTCLSGYKLPPDIRQAAEESLKAYKASDEYHSLIMAIPETNLYQLNSHLATALNGTYFKDLIKKICSWVLTSNELPIKAISIGISGQIVLGFGVSGSVGYIMDLCESNPDNGVYLGGAVDVGLDVGLDAGPCIGLWGNKTKDIGGLYIGEEIDVDDGVGGEESNFLKDEKLALIFVGTELGFDDGLEDSNYYFFEFNLSDQPIYQPGESQYLVQFNTLTCHNSKDNYDRVYFEFEQDNDGIKYRYPAWNGYQLAQGSRSDGKYQHWQVGLIAKFNSQLKIILHVGNHTITKTITADCFSGLNATYSLDFNDTVNLTNKIK